MIELGHSVAFDKLCREKIMKLEMPIQMFRFTPYYLNLSQSVAVAVVYYELTI